LPGDAGSGIMTFRHYDRRLKVHNGPKGEKSPPPEMGLNRPSLHRIIIARGAELAQHPRLPQTRKPFT
jgi:hypothetical protein